MNMSAQSQGDSGRNSEARHTARPAGTPRRQPLSNRNHVVAFHHYDSETIDWPLLHWLLRCPFLSTEDLAAFCGVSHSTTTRHLTELEDRGLIECVTPASLVHSGIWRLYYLSNEGISLVAASMETDANKLARLWEGDELRLLNQLPRLSHLLRVQSVIRGLLMGAPQALGEQGRDASGTWHWVRNYRHAFAFQSRSHMLKLDAVLVFHVTRVSAGGRIAYAKFINARNPGSTSTSEQSRHELRDDWYAALLLADAPVQDWRAATRTLDMILSYRESPERWPVYDHFPPLLVLAENVRNAERLQQVARTCADLRQLPPLRGAIAVVPHPPSLPHSDDAWRLPWRDLMTGLPCHLTQVMLRHSQDAVPPASNGSDAPKPLAARKGTVIVPQPHSHVVIGRFAERALSVALECSQPDSHAGVPRESLLLLSLQLGARLTEILTLLLRVPGIQVADLADLLGIQLPSVDRYVSDLDHYGLLRCCRNAAQSSGGNDRSKRAIQQNHFSYDPFTAVRLSDSGHRLATATQRMSPQSQFARRAASKHPQHVENLWVPTAHNLGVYHFFALLARAAAAENYHLSQEALQSARHRLIWWDVGMLAERRYRYQGRWHHLRPDGAGCFRANAKLFSFWLEWDQGSMNLSDLTRKFISYYTYLASGAWRETFDRVFPHLLVVVQSFGQLRRMQRAAATASASYKSPSGGVSTLPLKASITLAGRLDESGPLAPIWWPLLPATSVPTPSTFYSSG